MKTCFNTQLVVLDPAFTHIMLDIETGGVGPDAWIAQIGMAVMNPDKHELEFPWEVSIDPQYEQINRKMDPLTMMWWANPSRVAAFKQVWVNSKIHLMRALEEFTEHVDLIKTDTGKSIRIWSKGPSFDMAIMIHAFQQYGLTFPVSFRNLSCYRTVAAMFPELKQADARIGLGMEPDETDALYHTAYSDVVHQGLHLMWIDKVVKQADQNG